MKKIFNPIPAALLFAILIVASAYFLKSSAAGVWVNAAIYTVWTYFAFRYFTGTDKVCRTQNAPTKQ